MSFNSNVIELLNADGQLTVPAIAGKTALSINYVRTQLRHMEQAGIIERVDDRLPIIYRTNKHHELVKNNTAVKEAKKELLAPASDKDNAFVKLLKTAPKKHWPEAIDTLAVLAVAIRELNDEGKLVDTL